MDFNLSNGGFYAACVAFVVYVVALCWRVSVRHARYRSIDARYRAAVAAQAQAAQATPVARRTYVPTRNGWRMVALALALAGVALAGSACIVQTPQGAFECNVQWEQVAPGQVRQGPMVCVPYGR